MTADCLNQYTCLAANINFNVDGLLKSFWQLTIDGLSWGSIYALVAVGYTLVFGVLRLINFAHSEIFMLGMFGAYFCLDMILGFTPSGNAYNKGVLLTVFYLGIAMLFGYKLPINAPKLDAGALSASTTENVVSALAATGCGVPGRPPGRRSCSARARPSRRTRYEFSWMGPTAKPWTSTALTPSSAERAWPSSSRRACPASSSGGGTSRGRCSSRAGCRRGTRTPRGRRRPRPAA